MVHGGTFYFFFPEILTRLPGRSSSVAVVSSRLLTGPIVYLPVAVRSSIDDSKCSVTLAIASASIFFFLANTPS